MQQRNHLGHLHQKSLRPVRQTSRPWYYCKMVFGLLCLVLLGYLSYAGIHFAMVFSQGMEYMREEESHLLDTTLRLNGHALAFYKINDQVMGGHSTSRLSKAPGGGLRFSGDISTKDGGFASCSSLEVAPSLGLAPTTTGFRLDVTGNWELYKLTLKTSTSVWEPIWEADLPDVTVTEPNKRHAVVIPLDRFTASRMGRPVPDTVLNVTSVMAIGLNLALVDVDGSPNPHFSDGPFEITLHNITEV